MKKLKYIIAISIAFQSCNKIDCPNENGCDPLPPSLQSCLNPQGIDTCKLELPLDTLYNNPLSFKPVLIEEYTGYKCNNCPNGAREIEILLAAYGDSLIAVSIHAGFFSEPDGDKYKTDFRTPSGDIYSSIFDILSNPIAVINRKKFDDVYGQSQGKWAGLIASELDNQPTDLATINLKILHSISTGYFLIDGEIEYSGTNSLAVIFMLLESDLIDVQQDGADYVTDYVHKHIFRGTVGNAWGTTLSFQDGKAFVKSDYFKFDNVWNSNKMQLVTLVYDVNSKEVVQVSEMHL